MHLVLDFKTKLHALRLNFVERWLSHTFEQRLQNVCVLQGSTQLSALCNVFWRLVCWRQYCWMSSLAYVAQQPILDQFEIKLYNSNVFLASGQNASVCRTWMQYFQLSQAPVNPLRAAWTYNSWGRCILMNLPKQRQECFAKHSVVTRWHCLHDISLTGFQQGMERIVIWSFRHLWSTSHGPGTVFSVQVHHVRCDSDESIEIEQHYRVVSP